VSPVRNAAMMSISCTWKSVTRGYDPASVQLGMPRTRLPAGWWNAHGTFNAVKPAERIQINSRRLPGQA
jgi:hypothetical protein